MNIYESIKSAPSLAPYKNTYTHNLIRKKNYDITQDIAQNE